MPLPDPYRQPASVEPAPRRRRGLGVIIDAAIVVVGMFLGLVVVFAWFVATQDLNTPQDGREHWDAAANACVMFLVARGLAVGYVNHRVLRVSIGTRFCR